MTGEPLADGRASRWFRLPGVPAKATNFELFFDLVYVFAITQLGTVLKHDLSWHGAGHTMLLLFMVWWAWNYTTWMANWYDPDRLPVRLTLILGMLLSLLMAVAIPHAFDGQGLLFAGSYVLAQVTRNTFNVFGVARTSSRRLPFVRILAWSVLSGIPMVIGGFVHGHARAAWWVAALVIDLIGPQVRYWLPGLGASSITDWTIDAHHFAERFQLLVIIALGEGIVVIGSGVDHVTGATVTALVCGFAITVSMWWLYFDYIAETAQRRLARAAPDDVGRLARDGFTYLHLPMVAGIVCSAVSLKFVIGEPHLLLDGWKLWIALAGPVLYLVGHNLFRKVMAGTMSPRRFVVSGMVLAIGLASGHVTALQVSAWIALLMVGLVAWETWSVRTWYRQLPPDRRPPSMAHLERYWEPDDPARTPG